LSHKRRRMEVSKRARYVFRKLMLDHFGDRIRFTGSRSKPRHQAVSPAPLPGCRMRVHHPAVIPNATIYMERSSFLVRNVIEAGFETHPERGRRFALLDIPKHLFSQATAAAGRAISVSLPWPPACGYRIRFCRNCGSTLYWEGDRNPAVYGVAVGAFEPSAFRHPATRSGRSRCIPGSACPRGWSTTSRADQRLQIKLQDEMTQAHRDCSNNMLLRVAVQLHSWSAQIRVRL
jgi:hypothetical protein